MIFLVLNPANIPDPSKISSLAIRMTAAPLQQMIDALTCRGCNGHGQLASSAIPLFDGIGYPIRTVIDCPRCDGTGVDPEPGRRGDLAQ